MGGPAQAYEASATAQGGAGLVGLVSQIAQGYQAAKVARTNAKLARMEADSIREAAAYDIAAHRARVRQEAGEYRAARASSGLDVASASFQDSLAAREYFGELDSAVIRQRAEMAAWGKEYESKSEKYKAKQAILSGYGAAAGTLLEKTGTVADLWAKRNQSMPPGGG